MTIILSNFTPTGSYANPNDPVSFDLTSDGSPIDLSTLTVYFDEAGDFDPAISSGNPQDGYNVSIASTSVGGNPGYTVVILPSRPFKSVTVATLISVDTEAGGETETFTRYFATATYSGYVVPINPLAVTEGSSVAEAPGALTFSKKAFNILFQLNDLTEPAITDRIPVVNSNDSEPDTDIQFALHDYGQEGVNILTLEVWINGDLAVTSGSFIFPYTGTITNELIDDFDGWSILINPAYDFPFEQVVDVRVRVQDLVTDPAAVNTLDTTYQFQIRPYIDVEGPEAEPIVPPSGLGLDACIEFNWLDEPFGDGPDWDTLNVTLRRELTVECITSIRDDIAVANGIAAPGYSVYSDDITIGFQIGYHVWVCHEVPFNEDETITVLVDGYDVLGNEGTTSSFDLQTVELTPPTILNFLPDNGDADVAIDSTIFFEMHDSAGSGVNPDRLTIHLDNAEAVIEGVVQTGYLLETVEKVVTDQFGLIFDGYEFTLTRDTDFLAGDTIPVLIDGYDMNNNQTRVTYSFSTAPDVTAPVVSFVPESGATGMNRNQNILVDVTDVSGVNPSETNIWINGEQAFASGSGLAPFDTEVSSITDGYRYFIDTENDWGFNELVTTRVQAKDVYDNLADQTSTFRTFKDTVGPSINEISPRDGQEEVSLTPTITFNIRDGYDVALELTEISVGGQLALQDGLPQSGYAVVTSRISGGVEGVDPGDGYYISLSPPSPFSYSAEIDVNIKAYDRSQNNLTEHSVTWYTIDPLVPKFQIIPELGQTNVSLDSNVRFEIYEDGYGIDINTLKLVIDETTVIEDGIFINSDYAGTITTGTPNEFYWGEVDPRYLFLSSATHTVVISADESTSGKEGSLTVTFRTDEPLANPETLYIASSSGVVSLATGAIDGYTGASTLIDGYYVNDLSAQIINEINRLGVATRDHGAFVYPTNYPWPTTFYSVGDEIVKIHLSALNNGTLYLANRSRDRVDVYYNILADDVGRSIPDVYYAAANESSDGYAVGGILDGYFTDMVVTEQTSSVVDDSSTIYLGTPSGVFKIDTDESVPGNTEINGILTSYGVVDSGYTHDVLGGTSNRVVALDVNIELNHLYVATRSESDEEVNALTYIDLVTNKRTGVILEAELLHRLINDIDFQG